MDQHPAKEVLLKLYITGTSKYSIPIYKAYSFS